ncbi:helix-turn-helix domain-containing protein [Pampinifervens florentissimum]|uniref:helix-turn-helix domain-containing protein n=1 Tax=Pampinifervens florentissimum TaxID=1632019 RepID=UPI0013B49621|nr:helix-turn-helix transcriptional regulator [Hydrogenobacter sp. T-8]QID32298.1 helix-turn-helix transcriptional regulator [Hydrogenobacter sp. T-8]
MQTTIKEIIRQECRNRGISLYKLAKDLGINLSYLSAVLSLTKVSRPTIFKIADYLHRPDLLFVYEKELRSRVVESKSEKSTQESTINKGGEEDVRGSL